MPTGQQYATNVPQTTLTSLINPTAPSMSVFSSSGWPSVPFTAVLDIGTASQEPVDVTNVVGTTWTITRAIDGTLGFQHGVGATVTHGDIGRDFREARSHIDASSTPDATGKNVHGLATSSSVVGTTDVQTLTNKSLTAPTVTGTVGGSATYSNPTLTTATFSGATAMGAGAWTGTGSLLEPSVGSSGQTGAPNQTRLVGAGTGGTAPTSGTFQVGDIYLDETFGVYWWCKTAGTPGTWLLLGNGSSLTVAAIGTVNVPTWANIVRITWSARSGSAGVGGDFLTLRINNDSSSNYVWGTNTASGATGGTSAVTNSAGTDTSVRIGVIPDTAQTANWFGAGQVTISNCQASTFKPVTSYFNGPITTTNIWSGTGGGLYDSVAAVGSVSIQTLFGTSVASSQMSVEFLS